MDWADFKCAEDKTWEAFFETLTKNGVCRDLAEFIESDMDAKDIFNDVSSCIMSRVKFDYEEEE